MRLRITICAAILGLVAGSVTAGPILWVSDSAGRLGSVDVATGTVLTNVNMGITMTDIAFDPSGQLYGLNFGSVYSIDESTGVATLIGAHGIAGGNALVFSSTGTLYGAGNSSSSLYEINVATGGGTALAGSIGGTSSGDLAFNSGVLYLAANTSPDSLRSISLGPPVTSGLVGSLGLDDVFGLATADDGVLYGVSGTSVYSINTTTGLASLVSSYGGQGLGTAYGSAFYTEAGAEPVPEPGTLLLIGSGITALVLRRRRRA